MKQLELVTEFNLKYNLGVSKKHGNKNKVEYSYLLIIEEITELYEALSKGDRVQILKEATDVLYSLLSVSLTMGYQNYFKQCDIEFKTFGFYTSETFEIFAKEFRRKGLSVHLHQLYYTTEALLSNYTDVAEFERIFEAIHHSNMSKGTNGIPEYSTTGKLLKGTDFTPADLSFLKQ